MKEKSNTIKKGNSNNCKKREPSCILHFHEIKKNWKETFEKFDAEFEERRPEFPPGTVFGTTTAFESIADPLKLPTRNKIYRFQLSDDTVSFDPENLPDDFSLPEQPDLTNIVHSSGMIVDTKGKRESSSTLNTEKNLRMKSKDDKIISLASKPSLTISKTFFNGPEERGKSAEKSESFMNNFDTGRVAYTLDDLSVLVDETDFNERLMEEKVFKLKKGSKQKIYTGNQREMIKFFKKDEKTAAWWRPATESTAEKLNAMSLPQRAAFVENKVASEFCDWLDSLGGTKSDLNATTLIELFQIGLVNPASHSMLSTYKEKSFIPDCVAKVREAPKKSFRHVLQRHLSWDVYASKRKPKKLAFNKILPPEDRINPSNNMTAEEWLKCKTIPKELINFEAVFSKILHLRALEAFCNYITKRQPSLKPSVLVSKGVFERAAKHIKTSISYEASKKHG